ncbi:hypothetical protein HMPREF0063_10062 [Aeromicrobium marinum DSM 15272]|uniref:Uncharacterized protein n=1 Tax=Aeromicrobium marinum DSM 15272 TaxID=585531 RepID=E2S7Q5_9ACTN|nr:hypothetical protein [Aeromicrobium marinum]EFQ84721.1 hypothetical protein HMPREF0063_10062 [Aeromicrobium marinum DSM 15272]
MASIPDAAQRHYRLIQRLQLLAVGSGRRAWDRLDGRAVGRSWDEQIALLYPVVTAIQQRSAVSGATYSAMTIAEQGTYLPPSEFVDPNAFVGYASDGRTMVSLLTAPAAAAGSRMSQGMAVRDALLVGRSVLDRILETQVADAARQAAGADIASRPGAGYVRVVSVGACSRCTVLAGRFYRWNKGFLRHPNCNCSHVGTSITSQAEAITKGLIDDPYQAFSELSETQQDRIYTKAGAKAIREGADISQVVNSRRGMTPNGLFTTEGTTRFGNARTGLRAGQRRLTPEGIYEQAERFGRDRQWAVERLREHGYILPAGQIPTGALRGQREGFGQLGSGGRRRAAREAIEEARRTGVRDPRSRYTMTAAERRLNDARRRYEVALSGRSPYSSPGFGNTPDPMGLGLNRGGTRFVPVTPTELAMAEREYRAYLATGGQIFDR